MKFQSERLRDAREKKGLTQKELAHQCGFNEFQVSRYETGRTDPTLENLAKMAQLLDVSTDYLLGLLDSPIHLSMSGETDPDESLLLNTFRREGWTGVIQLGAQKLPK